MNIPVFYDDVMVCDSGGYSPSAAKPKYAVGSWLAMHAPIDIIAPNAATCEQLCRAHSERYVQGVFNGTRPNGFGNTLDSVAATLPYTTGSMIDAARAALHNGVGAVSPTSGFHHAGFGGGNGFCTFNGLMVAALELADHRVGILDFDAHYGDGTDDIILQLRHDVVHFSQGEHKFRDGAHFIGSVKMIVEALFDKCDIVLYQAGADMHIDDPLAAGFLTTQELFMRDSIVFHTLKKLNVPVVWNLAGGYQRPMSKVTDIHDNTMRAFMEVWNV